MRAQDASSTVETTPTIYGQKTLLVVSGVLKLDTVSFFAVTLLQPYSQLIFGVTIDDINI